jgi:hypothetical protein
LNPEERIHPHSEFDHVFPPNRLTRPQCSLTHSDHKHLSRDTHSSSRYTGGNGSAEWSTCPLCWRWSAWEKRPLACRTRGRGRGTKREREGVGEGARRGVPSRPLFLTHSPHLPIVGIVVTISPSFNLYRMVVLPAASSPTTRREEQPSAAANTHSDQSQRRERGIKNVVSFVEKHVRQVTQPREHGSGVGTGRAGVGVRTHQDASLLVAEQPPEH